jgi:hypothetical protein
MTLENLSSEGRELYFYTVNDSFFSPAYYAPAYKKLGEFHKKGTFSLDRAIAYLNRYLVLPAAKDYRLQFGSMTDSVKSMFPAQERAKVAEVLAREMVSEFQIGNY